MYFCLFQSVLGSQAAQAFVQSRLEERRRIDTPDPGKPRLLGDANSDKFSPSPAMRFRMKLERTKLRSLLYRRAPTFYA